jgi:hypothetical protein
MAMKVALFNHGKNGNTHEHLKNVAASIIAHSSLETYSDFSLFYDRLRHIPREIDVAVLVAGDMDRLFELVSLKDYLDGIHVILVLPGRDPDMVSMGYRLYPRYMGYTDEDLTNVGLVLEKMNGFFSKNRNGSERLTTAVHQH